MSPGEEHLEQSVHLDARCNKQWRVVNTLGALTFIGFLWLLSYPGLHPVTILLTLFSLLLGVGWIVMITRSLERDVNTATVSAGPVLAITLLVLFLLNAPLQIRFAAASSAFDRQVAVLEPAGSYEKWKPLKNAPDRIGTYGIGSGYQVGEGVIFYENVGAFLNDAGFAYLPDGLSETLENGSFEAPQFRHISGDWYSWIASW